MAAPATAISMSVGRTRRSRPCSPAMKKADAVGRPQEKMTPNSQGSTRSSAYSPTTVGPPVRATSRLATDTAARAPPCAPRLVMACLDSSRDPCWPAATGPAAETGGAWGR